MSQVEIEATEVENQQQNENGKVEKQYNANIKKLTAILGGEQLFKGAKVSAGTELSTLVDELTKERKEATVKKVKEGLIKLLDQQAESKKKIVAKQRELDNLDKELKKEFNKAFSSLVSEIDNIGEVERGYYAALRAQEPTPTSPATPGESNSL